MSEPKRIRWVRYAADCAERVLPLTGKVRPQAVAAIRAARVWADEPTEAHRLAAGVASRSNEAARLAARVTARAAWVAADVAADAAGLAAEAAYDAGSAAETAYDAGVAAYSAAWFGWVATGAVHTAVASPDIERAWQAKRRRHYGLLEEA